MYYNYYGTDAAYILVIAAFAFSLWASWKVKSTYRKYSNIRNARGITGASAARMVLNRNGLNNVPISPVAGTLTDYYDPSGNAVHLSQSSFSGDSAVAVGVACHECGHAIQYAENYGPAKIRMAIVPVTNLGSKLAMPLIIAGALLSSWIPVLWNLIYLGIGLFHCLILIINHSLFDLNFYLLQELSH